jgi:predicted phosphodiesterase
MRIAVVADIHGNVRALRAVMDDIKQLAPDTVVNLGDCVSGPLRRRADEPCLDDHSRQSRPLASGEDTGDNGPV